jgi:DNA-binding NarL/FixJ family response regulator
VLVVDDQAMVRQGFSALLAAQSGIEVVGDAADGAAAVVAVATLAPDVVLMDIRMPVLDGIEAIRRILATPRDPQPRVLVLTTFDLDDYVYEACAPGPVASCSRTRARRSWCRRSGWWPQATGFSRRA